MNFFATSRLCVRLFGCAHAKNMLNLRKTQRIVNQIPLVSHAPSTGKPNPAQRPQTLLHGLYSRQLQICGTHCPLWETCPCSNDDVLALPPKERPTCPYEQTEYNAFVTDAQAKSDCTHDPDPLDFHTIHTMALLHVMTNRAARTATGRSAWPAHRPRSGCS